MSENNYVQKAGKLEQVTRMSEPCNSQAITIASKYEVELIMAYRKMNTLYQEEILDVARAFAQAR